jgi:hypothetical protein
LKDNRSQYQSFLDEFARTAQGEADKREHDSYEMKKFCEEKVGILTRKKEDAITVFQMRPPRQSEIDIIEQLEALLHTKTIQLQNAVKDLQEYRKMRVEQEKTIAHRFRKPLKVGVFGPTAKIPHGRTFHSFVLIICTVYTQDRRAIADHMS